MARNCHQSNVVREHMQRTRNNAAQMAESNGHKVVFRTRTDEVDGAKVAIGAFGIPCKGNFAAIRLEGRDGIGCKIDYPRILQGTLTCHRGWYYDSYPGRVGPRWSRHIILGRWSMPKVEFPL